MTTSKASKIKAAIAAFAVCMTLALGGVTAAIANTDSNTQTGGTSLATQECQQLNTAVSNAVKNEMSVIDKFVMSYEKNAKRIMSNSCLGALQKLNFNLGGLIPDFNIFGALLDAAIDKFVTFLTDQVCDGINSVIGEWNEIANKLKVDFNVNSQMETWANDVLLDVPGGYAPAIGTPAGHTGIVSDSQTQLFDQGAGVNLGEYASGTGSSSSGSSNSLGSEAGAKYAQLQKDCEDKKSNWQSAYNNYDYYSSSYIESARVTALNACTSASNYYDQNKQYLYGLSKVTWPAAMSQSTSSTRSSGYSLPIRID